MCLISACKKEAKWGLYLWRMTRVIDHYSNKETIQLKIIMFTDIGIN